VLKLHPSRDRIALDLGWLHQHQTFPVARPHPGWFGLRVINEDRIAPGSGFGLHGHRDIEIISYVLAGSLAHRDDLGNITVVPAGDVQRMSAGTGIRHSEFNPDPAAATQFLQIWLEPATSGITPSYEQMTLHRGDSKGRFQLVASPREVDGSLRIHAHAWLYIGRFDGRETGSLPFQGERRGYVHMVSGTAIVNGRSASAGDGVFLLDEQEIGVERGRHAEVIAFDLGRGQTP
jgi:redox-sensitive bicupin YhaK (pirin superfamily)